MKRISFLCFITFLCFFFTPSTLPQEHHEVNYIWAQKAGGSGYDHAHGIITDSSDSVYITGFFEATSEFEDTSLTVTGNNFRDIFLAKYNHLGELQWAQKMGGNQLDEGLALACDQDDNIYVTGYFSSHANIGGIILVAAGDRDIFLAKFDTAGNILWARKAGGSGEDTGYAVKTDPAGNVLLAGSFMGSADFSGTGLVASGDSDICLVKYSSEGDLIWARQAGGKKYDHAYSLTIDQQGDSYLTGYFMGRADFGDTTLDSYGDRDVFITKYDPQGDCLWVKQAGGIYWDYGYSLTVDAENNIIATGFFYAEAVFDHFTVTAAAQNDIFLAKYDPDGNIIWVESAGGLSYDRAKSIITDNNGNIYIIGHFKESSWFENTELLAENQYYNIFIAKFTGSGELVWVKQLGSDGLWNDGSCIALDSFGSIYITGSFTSYEEPMVFSNTSLSADHFDIYLAKLGKVKKKIVFK